jgi:hypothetical protein
MDPQVMAHAWMPLFGARSRNTVQIIHGNMSVFDMLIKDFYPCPRGLMPSADCRLPRTADGIISAVGMKDIPP